VYAEFAALTAGRVCDVSGLSHGLLAEHGPQQWPFPQGSEPCGGSKRLYGDACFPTPSGRARFVADAVMGLAEPPCAIYPLVLTVGRYLGHWHTMTRTAKVERLQSMHPEPVLEIHPDDARRYGVVDGELGAVGSRRGSVTARVSVTDRIRPGSVFLPMHWGFSQELACEVNVMMHEQSCPISGQPELKAAAVIVAPAVSVVKPTEHSHGRLELLRRLFRDGQASAGGRA
jgi:ferredoxin-nitrate reductase